tara:strand:+ start:4985 stop:5218 length:234 start_codon:yes stop_codon:yes gene_type:complete
MIFDSIVKKPEHLLSLPPVTNGLPFFFHFFSPYFSGGFAFCQKKVRGEKKVGRKKGVMSSHKQALMKECHRHLIGYR